MADHSPEGSALARFRTAGRRTDGDRLRRWRNRELRRTEVTSSLSLDGPGEIVEYRLLWDGGYAEVYRVPLDDQHDDQWAWKFYDQDLDHQAKSMQFVMRPYDALDEVVAFGDSYYLDVYPDTDRLGTTHQHDLSLDIEAFVVLWQRLGPGLALDRDSRRAGDALAVMASELAKTENPPKSVLRSTFEWFAQKLDVFAEETAKSAGSTAGKAGIVAGGLAASGQLPKLIDLGDC